jgi:hypothetical protein
MPYPNPNATDITGVLTYANTVTGGWFWVLIIISLFIMSFGVLIAYNDAKKSFAASSFLTTIFSMTLFILDLIQMNVLVITLLMSFAGLMLMLFNK